MLKKTELLEVSETEEVLEIEPEENAGIKQSN